MRLAIVGSRRRDTPKDKAIVRRAILRHKPDMIISGGCPKGADRFAEELAKELGIPITIYYPKLPSRGSSVFLFRKAYLARNVQVAKNCDKMSALVAPDRKGGTEYTIKQFRKFVGDVSLEIL